MLALTLSPAAGLLQFQSLKFSANTVPIWYYPARTSEPMGSLNYTYEWEQVRFLDP